MILRKLIILIFAMLLLPMYSYSANIIPANVLSGELTTSQHPYAARINSFIVNQATATASFTPSGLTRHDYLPVIESIVRAMKKYQNAKGQIVDPLRGREFQYSTPCYAHAVAVLMGSGFVKDTALLSSGINAMDAAILHMMNNDVPDGHGDFFTVPLMLAYKNFKSVAPAAKLAKWKTDLAKINPSLVYGNSAPNWIGINMTGEFLRYLEGMRDTSYVESRILFQITRMGPDGLYQDSNTPETLSVTNIDGQSLPYDNVARAVLGIVASQGYNGKYRDQLISRLWKGAWSGLLYQSSLGEVPTGMRSSHHLWNEAEAAMNYEIWGAQYAAAGHPKEAGAFKRAAMLSLLSVKSWLRPDGSGYVTKARCPIDSQWGYMSYSSHTQYNLWCAAALGMAWQYADSSITEAPSPADVGGFAIPMLTGFKKIFANAGGSYVEYDVRGDHSHNPTGLLRIHLKTSNAQLGPSDGAVGKVASGAQYWPLYPHADPAGLLNLSVGPAWKDANNAWYPLAEVQKIPTVTILSETPLSAQFRVSYTIATNTYVNEIVAVDPHGVTVTDSIVGMNQSTMRVYFPMLVFDGEDKTTVTITGNQVALQLKGKGIKFTVQKPDGVTLIRSGVTRNHRNGKCEAIYAEINGQIAQYRITANPEYPPTGTAQDKHNAILNASRQSFLMTSQGMHVLSRVSGEYRLRLFTMQGKRVSNVFGVFTQGKNFIMLHKFPVAMGTYRAELTCGSGKLQGTIAIVK